MRTALLGLAFVACTVSTTDNFQNPPPPPPATCSVDETVVGCTAGSVGYACMSDRPDDGDTNLVCSAGTPGAHVTTFCCLPYAQYFTECTPDTSMVGCADPAFGFACSGGASPADADSRLACSSGAPNGSATTYCCVSSEIAPTCAPAPTIPCAGASIGFSCTGNASPGESDTSIACNVGSEGEAGATSRCCVPFLQSQGACEEDQTAGCLKGSYGFSCTGLNRPEASNSALTCTATADPSRYCCTL